MIKIHIFKVVLLYLGIFLNVIFMVWILSIAFFVVYQYQYVHPREKKKKRSHERYISQASVYLALTLKKK